MRDIVVPDISFTTAEGTSVIIKDMREFDIQTVNQNYGLREGDTLDMVAVNMYGDNAESDGYKIFDQNVAKIVDNNFSLKNIKQLEIPN